MPQPPNPKTGQGHPGQSDPENRAVTHTKPRRFSLNSRRIDRCPPNYYWSRPLTPFRNHTRDRAVAEAITRGYGDVAMDVPVPSAFGRHLIEYLIEHDFDVAHVRDVKPAYGGRVARRYPTRTGELQYVRETAPREQGLPHGVSFVVKRLFDNQPRPILPVFQNSWAGCLYSCVDCTAAMSGSMCPLQVKRSSRPSRS